MIGFLKKISLLTVFLFSSIEVFGQEKTLDEKKAELLDFQSIRNILKNDSLEKIVEKKRKALANTVVKKEKKIEKSFLVPTEDEIWNFISEYWIVLNAQKLKWDFKKPHYGVVSHFEAFLEKMGFLEKKFKILILDTSLVTHFSLPANKNHSLFLLSLPFMRTLDLTKQEISVLLFEDFIRLNKGYFRDFVSLKEFKALLGSNFKKGKLKTESFFKVHKRFDQFIFNKGFSFQQQFLVTKEVARLLKGHPEYLSVYMNLLKKIDYLIKTRKEYKSYVNIYPSPELQLNWLKSENSKI
tara:strand:- start:6809 stop:7699 length:891 start_codon:yes stop_codon:yes gene_type:complete